MVLAAPVDPELARTHPPTSDPLQDDLLPNFPLQMCTCLDTCTFGVLVEAARPCQNRRRRDAAERATVLWVEWPSGPASDSRTCLGVSAGQHKALIHVGVVAAAVVEGATR